MNKHMHPSSCAATIPCTHAQNRRATLPCPSCASLIADVAGQQSPIQSQVACWLLNTTPFAAQLVHTLQLAHVACAVKQAEQGHPSKFSPAVKHTLYRRHWLSWCGMAPAVVHVTAKPAVPHRDPISSLWKLWRHLKQCLKHQP